MKTVTTDALNNHAKVKVMRFNNGSLAGAYLWSSNCWRNLTEKRHTEVFKNLPAGEYITKHPDGWFGRC